LDVEDSLNGRLRRMKMMMEPRPSTDRNGRLGH